MSYFHIPLFDLTMSTSLNKVSNIRGVMTLDRLHRPLLPERVTLCLITIENIKKI